MNLADPLLPPPEHWARCALSGLPSPTGTRTLLAEPGVQIRREEDDISSSFLVQLRRPLASLSDHLLRCSRLLPFFYWLLPHSRWRRCERGKESGEKGGGGKEKLVGGVVVWLAEEDDGRARRTTGEQRCDTSESYHFTITATVPRPHDAQ